MDNLIKKVMLLRALLAWLEPGNFLDVLDVIDAPPDAYKVQMRDGRMLLARLDEDNRLQLDEIDGVC